MGNCFIRLSKMIALPAFIWREYIRNPMTTKKRERERKRENKIKIEEEFIQCFIVC